METIIFLKDLETIDWCIDTVELVKSKIKNINDLTKHENGNLCQELNLVKIHLNDLLKLQSEKFSKL